MEEHVYSVGSDRGSLGSNFIVFFEQGDGSQKDLLGGKGAGLAEMTRAGLPVPPGFTITTEACLSTMSSAARCSPGLIDAVHDAIHELERCTARASAMRTIRCWFLRLKRRARLDARHDLQDTTLNLGLNGTPYAVSRATPATCVSAQRLRRAFQEDVRTHRRSESAARRLSSSWRWQSAPSLIRGTRSVRSIIAATIDLSDDWGTAVNIVSMVFGNLGDDSGTGVAFTRDPSTGEKKLHGEYLRNAQGEDVVAGIRTPEKISDLEKSQPEIYKQFVEIAKKLEAHYRDVQRSPNSQSSVASFTCSRRAARNARQKPPSRSRSIFCTMARSTNAKRSSVLDAASLDQLFHARLICTETPGRGQGSNASPGAATGEIVLDPDTAVVRAKAGKKVVLVRTETNPDDVHGIIAAQGVLTAKGGATSHAAVVARGMGKPCVAGLDALRIDLRAKKITLNGATLKEGDEITLDGTTGNVIFKKLTLIPPPSKLPEWLNEFLALADKYKKLGVWANADTPEDAKRARELGATGIGLTRTEHMFMQRERLPFMQDMILAKDAKARGKFLKKLLTFQRRDFKGILEAMAGLTVTIRLLDPPLHEFLPSLETLLVETTELRIKRGENSKKFKEKSAILARVRELHEQNPMLGLRVCRLGIVYPEIYAMQIRAIFEAAVALRQRGVDVRPDVMIPGVGTEEEMRVTADAVKKIADEIIADAGVDLTYHVGTMVELPRACIIADKLAEIAEFFSFGTNDLTQTTYGYSRDDAEGSFIPFYLQHKILKEDPFQVLDRVGVGELMREGIGKGRGTRPDLKIGICGEHGGDPSSVEFCHEVGLDYVSCSPYRVPIARLAAAQAAL